MQVSDHFNFNLFSVTRVMLEGFELGGNAEELTLKKGNCDSDLTLCYTHIMEHYTAVFSKGEYKKRRLQIHPCQLAENLVEAQKALKLKSQS